MADGPTTIVRPLGICHLAPGVARCYVDTTGS